MEIVILIIGICIGLIVGWVVAKLRVNSYIQSEIANKTTVAVQLETAKGTIDNQQHNINLLNQTIQEHINTVSALNNQLSTSLANFNAAKETISNRDQEIITLKDGLKTHQKDLSQINQLLATANANLQASNDKLELQKKEMEELNKKFTQEFKLIANEILGVNSEKFTELNKTNLKAILEPLGNNIKEFKTKVEEVYGNEARERFSLGEKVKEMALLHQVMSEETRNLTKALKGEAKTQGRWGEIILESILEKSGLVKNREYFMESELLDDAGNALKSDLDGKKMRPDAVIKYPDNRSVIIDSKVSLNAYTRYTASTDIEEQKTELKSHITDIKNHIISLSAKGYDDYDKTLDFVIMFIPIEPAYILALQGDPDIVHFAYDKRILLVSSSNLIFALKIIVDLWKREYQNRNAFEIAERGAKLYDKFVGFIENLDDVGNHLNKAQEKYSEAYKQLSTGNDNLVLQANKLKKLGLKTKKSLSADILNTSMNNELIDSPGSQGELL